MSEFIVTQSHCISDSQSVIQSCLPGWPEFWVQGWAHSVTWASLLPLSVPVSPSVKARALWNSGKGIQ